VAIRRVASYEYKNDYLYIIIRQVPEHGPKTYALCCGIDIRKFDPLCRGTSGIGSNPAFKGLQLLRADISAIALKKGASTRPLHYGECMLVSPRGDGWYRESMLLDNVTPRIAREALEFGVKDLLTKVMTVCAPGTAVPKKLPTPPVLQKYIQSLEAKKS
jgi:hypothetical protein